VRPPRPELFSAQLALSQIHPRLAPVQRLAGGYALDVELTGSWFELPAQRGFAGYGLARALRILLDVLSGLAALHDTRAESGSGFVHGEVVPALLRVDQQGVGRLIPLAAWHYWSEAGAAPTPRHERHGHLAPERLLGDAIDQRADVFSCGVLLWEALAGGRLFDTDSVETIVTRLMGGKVQLPQLPPELAWAIPLKSVAMRALSVDPAQRFKDCAELAVAIEEVAQGRIATHDEVAAFFGARAHSSVPPQPGALNHNSSLSALVAPVLDREEPAAVTQPPLSEPTPSSLARRLWSAAALLSLLAALGVTWLARHSDIARAALQSAPHSDAAVAPTLRQASRAPDAPALSAAAPLAAPSTSREPAIVAPPTDSHPETGHSAAKGTRHVHALKATAPRDKSADKYGI
jgi:hypothetical protein